MSFSVLMSVYIKEKPEYLSEALDSVAKQTLLPSEIVLIKDGMLTSELETVITEYQQILPQLITYQFEENVQLGRALAKGVELCSNELIARMDTDDIAAPERFEHQYLYMVKHEEVAVCGGWLQEFDDAGTYSNIKKMPEFQEELLVYAKYRNPLNHMTVMFRRSEILKVGNYKHFPLLEDYALWIRVLADGGFIYNLPEVLVYMRTNDGVYERRGGMEYFKQYMKLRKEQKCMGLLKVNEYVLAFVLTAGMTLQPSRLRRIMYRRVLRRNA